MDKIIKVSQNNKKFPQTLKEIYNPPKQLYILGKIPSGRKIAIVGMRKNSPYGEKAVKAIVPNLVRAGIITISGLAYGIDSLVHRYTLENNGKTIAILGSGINCIYPQSNLGLAREIITSGGALISEYEPNEEPKTYYFPQRNRIVAGLADAVIVIEAALKSGSLITAKIALEEGRDVWAVPGRIDDESSQGTNHLISQGAIPLLDSEQFLSYYKLSVESSPKNLPDISQRAKELYQVILTHNGETIDKLALTSKLDMSEINIYITELELNKLIINNNGFIYHI